METNIMKEEVVKALTKEAYLWLIEKMSHDRMDDRYWRLRAKAALFGEAVDVVRSVVLPPEMDFYELKWKLLESIAAYKGWGRGGAWSAAIQNETFAKVFNFIAQYLNDNNANAAYRTR